VTFKIAGIVAAALFATGVSAQAQTYPTREIRMVVGLPAGSGGDVVARYYADKLSQLAGKPVIVENKPGMILSLGADAVAKAPPDGYTILITSVTSSHAANLFNFKKLPYDPIKDFTPIIAAVEPVTCLAVAASLPVNSVAELIAYAKAHPDELSYGSSGVGSVFHLMGELFNQTAGVTINHVPYRGVAPALQDVVAGHIPMAYLSISNAIALGDTRSIKILAVLEPARFSRRPDIPSLSEAVPAFKKPSSWFGLFGPAGLPVPIATRLNAEIVKALNAPEVRAKLDENGMAVLGGTPDDFRALIADGIVRYGAIIKAAGVQAE
jgi:tripartite-type tricarboxylate transporter receptor subunit TctC